MSVNEELAELQRDWKAPVELRRTGPGALQLSGGGIALACLAVLMLIGAIAAAVGLSRVSARQEAERESLRAAGAEVQAVVTRHWRTGGKSETRKIAYEFEYEGRRYHGTSSTPSRIWRTLSVGSPLAV